MVSVRKEFDLLLAAPTPTEAQMAQSVLAEAGIPSLIHGMDRDLAELGYMVHSTVAHPDLFVPKGAKQRALGVLQSVWDAHALEHMSPRESWDAPGSELTRESPATHSRQGLWIWIVFVLAIVAIALTLVRDHTFHRPGAGSSSVIH